MKLTILGSGTAVPVLNRNCAGYILEVDGMRLLFDSGAGTIRRLLELGIVLDEIEHVFYTHLHNDHINDLGGIIWSSNYGGTRKNDLNLYGPSGFRKFFRTLLKKLLRPTRLNFGINVKELKNSVIKIGNIKINTCQTIHSSTTRSIIYRVTYKNNAFVYTGDTDYCTEVVEAARNAHTLLTECSFPDSKKVEGHLTPSLAGRIAAQANVKQLVLSHFYPNVLKTDIRKRCGASFKGKLILAKDKMNVSI